ncbi:MAG: PAAR domain-containing protein [Phycisphaerales bacterium]
MPAAARVSDLMKQDSPHCHAPMHPPAPVPTPVPHPGLPLAILPPGAATVMIGKLAAARATDLSAPCSMPVCIPGGPGMIAKGSMTVMIMKLPAARSGDMTAHTACVAPIPGPTGTILPPCCPTVSIGG